MSLSSARRLGVLAALLGAACSPPMTDAGVDASADSVRDSLGGDAAVVDVTDARADAFDAVAPMDALDESAEPDSTTVPDAGSEPPPGDARDADAALPDGAIAPVERPMPWRTGGCSFWTQNPPAVAYAAPLPMADGVWAFATQLAMHQTASGWVMAVSPDDGLGPFEFVEEYDGAMIAGNTTRAWVRRGAVWTNFADAPWSAPAGRVQVVHGELYVTTATTLHRYAAGAWTTLGAPGPVTLAGSPSALYGSNGATLRYYDGTRWTDLVMPATDGMRVASAGPSEVYAVNGQRLYRMSGSTFVPEPVGVPCAGGTLAVLDVLGGSGRLVLHTRCGAGGPTQTWMRAGTTWSQLPDRMGIAINLQRTRITSAGEVYTSADTVLRLGAAGWISLLETPMPPVVGVIGRAPGEVYAYGNGGLARHAMNRWEPVAAASALTVKTALQVSDGTIFMTAAAAPNLEVWRLRGTTLTRDLVVPIVASDPRQLQSAGYLAARAADDVYLAAGNQVHRWNGAAWSTVAGPVCPRPRSVVSNIVFGDAGRVVAHCFYHGVVDETGEVVEFDGTSWSVVPLSTPAGLPNRQVYQFGPISAGTVLVNDVTTGRGWTLWSAAGFLRWTPPTPSSFTALVAFSPTNLMAFFGTSVGFSDGTAPWRMISLGQFLSRDGWPAGSFGGRANTVWTDGRVLAAPGMFGGLTGLGYCDLGP